MSVTTKSRGPIDLTPILAIAGMGTGLLAVFGLWFAVRVGDGVEHRPAPPRGAFPTVIALATGKLPWPGAPATAFAIGELVLVLALALALWRLSVRLRRPRREVDAAARHLAARRELAPYTLAGVRKTAARLGGVPVAGLPIGRAIGSGTALYSGWEDESIDIWGPRKGKTTSRAIPALLEAPGCRLATSNKRDIVDCTRGILEQKAGGVWIFDPQQIATAPASWWWNPLDFVTSVSRAARLAAVFAGFSRPADAKVDAFFDTKGETLLAFLLLAAAVGNKPITKVLEWSLEPTDATPLDLLRRAGYTQAANSLQGAMNEPDKQRGGVYATAEKAVAWLTDPQIAQWVTADPHRPARPRFDPDAFVAGDGTLYLLSKEGEGSAGPLTTALTVATVEAAEQRATRSPGGRLAVPMVCVLDEAANVCRWRNLPDLYSHLGSRGVICLTILQSWSQGVHVWGELGMAKLWSAANIRVYGGGVSETKFLGDISALLGDFEPQTRQLSVSRGAMPSVSTSLATRTEKILEVSDLAALPAGRCVLLPSGARPVLVETQQYKDGPWAGAVAASLAKYAPTPEIESFDAASDAP